MTHSVTTREPEWVLDDVAAVQAAREHAADIGPEGVPTQAATDGDTDLDDPDGTTEWEAYSYANNAARAIRAAQDDFETAYGPEAARDRVWGVRRIPRRPRARY